MKILTLSKHKPITYSPGMISLILLPLFCMVYLNQHKAFVQYNALDIAVWSPDMQRFLPKGYPKVFPPARNYLRINLAGDNLSDKSRLDLARMTIRKMVASGDTEKGVDFHFWNTAKYETFISALDICQTENAEIYIPYQDDIYVMCPKPRAFKASDYIEYSK